MDLKALRAFCNVAEFGSFSRAATALGVAQSVLSRQVSALEIELGARLFYRSGRGATPTEPGKARGAEKVLQSEQMLVSPRGHPATRQKEVPLRVLDGLPLATPVRPAPVVAALSDLAARQRIRLNIVLEGSTSTIIREAVVHSGLCAVFARHYVERELKSEEFSASRIIKPLFGQTTWLAVGTQHPATVAGRAVARLVRETMLEPDRTKS